MGNIVERAYERIHTGKDFDPAFVRELIAYLYMSTGEARHNARRWSAAWKQAAKYYRAATKDWDNIGERAIFDIRKLDELITEARSIARRLLRERDETALLLTDCQERVDRYFAKITSLKSQVQFSEKQNQGLITHHRIERDRAAFENEALQSQVNHLESDRDALAKQCDEMREALEEIRDKGIDFDCPSCGEEFSWFPSERLYKALGKA